MREQIKDYISQFNNTLNFNGICWWIIDFKDEPDYFYCNEFMEDTFSLNKNLEKHSVAETCPIAGDYNKNIDLATSAQEKAKIVFSEYSQLISQEIDEYKNKFPYYNQELNKTFYFSSRAKILEKDEENNISVLYGIIEDITFVELQKKELEENSDTIDKYVMISTTDLQGNITDVSTSFCELSGYTKDELIGSNHNIIRHPDTPNETFKDMWSTIKSGNTWKGEIKDKNKNGESFWIYNIISPNFDEKGKISGYTSIKHDITDKKTIEKLSQKDKLTNLYNRIKIDDTLNKEIEKAKRYNLDFSIVIIDIDNFKSINDKHGHIVGDKILIEFAKILKTNIRKIDIAGRWGGEEFIIISENTNISSTQLLAEKLRLSIENFDFKVAGKNTASFGVSQYKENDTIESLINRADKALYKAKKSGKNRVEILK